jgi:sulfite oxidase
VSGQVIHGVDGLNTGPWPVSADHFITPSSRFFTRSHAPVPAVDPATWRLRVEGLVQQDAELSLNDLADSFSQRHVTATMVCAGLRREEFLSLGPLPGELPWGPEPISTGRWSGVPLADLLRAVGCSPGARHVELMGLDQVERQGARFGFGGSIDLDKALSGDVLLATALNGQPLPASHGFPVRAVVPGWIGARSVKWLARIALRDAPSDNYFQAKAYRFQRTANPDDPRDVSQGTMLTEIPVNSVIVSPAGAEVVRAGRVTVKGWAIGTGGRPLIAVELSPDAGESWVTAAITAAGERWTWSFWKAELTLPRGRHVLAARATDRDSSQPATVNETWNVKGYNNNAWHRVPVIVE